MLVIQVVIIASKNGTELNYILGNFRNSNFGQFFCKQYTKLCSYANYHGNDTIFGENHRFRVRSESGHAGPDRAFKITGPARAATPRPGLIWLGHP